MYIGPWQEYKFYGGYKKPRMLPGINKVPNKKNDDELKAEIEAALLAKLDQESAKKAMEAMYPLLGDISSGRKPTNMPLFEQIDITRTNSKASTEVILPSINSAREQRDSLSRTPSVRSSKSEPPLLPSRAPPKPKTPKLVNSNLPALALPRQPPYNTSSMLTMLKVDRSAREKAKLAKYWEWNGKVMEEKLKENGSQAPNQGFDLNFNPRDKNQVTNKLPVFSKDPTTKKLDEVNRMRKLYMENSEKNVNVEFPSLGDSTSNLKEINKQSDLGKNNITKYDDTGIKAPKNRDEMVSGKVSHSGPSSTSTSNEKNSEWKDTEVDSNMNRLASKHSPNKSKLHTTLTTVPKKKAKDKSDLTDDDIMKVSKYFSEEEMMSYGLSTLAKLPITDECGLDLGSNPPSRQASPEIKIRRLPSPLRSPLGMAGHGDDLIDWSRNLNLDEY